MPSGDKHIEFYIFSCWHERCYNVYNINAAMCESME
jgi:hypothetical protein